MSKILLNKIFIVFISVFGNINKFTLPSGYEVMTIKDCLITAYKDSFNLLLIARYRVLRVNFW